MWGLVAIGLGAWEAAALATRRVPTVTKSWRAARERRRRMVAFATILWMLALWRHLDG